MLNYFKRQRLTLIATLVLLVNVFIPFLTAPAYAGTLSQTFVRLSRHATSTAVTITVCANPATVGTEVDVQVTFPTGFTVSTTTGNWTVNTTNTAWPTGGTAWPGIGTATAAAGQVVTFPSTDLTVGTVYCFNTTNTAALSTPASAGNDLTGAITLRATGPSTIDSGAWGTSVISATFDQYTVGAVVPARFTYVGPGTATDNFTANLSDTALNTTTGKTVTLTANGIGWMLWAKSANAGLFSASRSKTIAVTTPGSNVTSTPGTEQYTTLVTVVDASGGGTVTPVAAYNTNMGSGLPTAAALATLATSNGTANGDTVTLVEKANVATATPAGGDYTDTITIVAAAKY